MNHRFEQLDAMLAEIIMKSVHACSGGAMMNCDADVILFLTLAIAFVFVFARTRTFPEVRRNWVIPGEGKFDVKTSWVANTTLFGAILGAPIKDFTPSGAINSLNVLFLALGAVAVLVQLIGVQSVKDGSGKDNYQTPVWSYLLAARVALWAAAGQLLTLAHMIWNAKPNVMSAAATVVFLASVALAAIVLAIYVWRIMGRHLQAAVAPEKFQEQLRTIEERYSHPEILLEESPGQPWDPLHEPFVRRRRDSVRGVAPVVAEQRTVL